MLKFEIKVPLNIEEYKYFQNNKFNKCAINSHINYYYDSKNLELDNLGITYRIRHSDDKYIASIKAHQSKNSECSIEVSKKVKNQYDTNYFFEKLNLILQGSLITNRTVYLSCNNLKIFFDENIYFDTKDYELEMHYDLKSEQDAVNFLAYFSGELYRANLTSSINELQMRRFKLDYKSRRFFTAKYNNTH